jgi:hypothetical protein
VLRERVGADHFDSVGQVSGTLIRHARAAPRPIGAVAITVIELSERARLMHGPGASLDRRSPRGATRGPAVDLPSIAQPAEENDRATSRASDFSQALWGHVRRRERRKLGLGELVLAACPTSARPLSTEGSGVQTWAFIFCASVAAKATHPHYRPANFPASTDGHISPDLGGRRHEAPEYLADVFLGDHLLLLVGAFTRSYLLAHPVCRRRCRSMRIRSTAPVRQLPFDSSRSAARAALRALTCETSLAPAQLQSGYT